MDKLLTQLVEKLQKAYGDRLVSVVLYGSAAAGDHHAKFSDLNVLCVLSEITPRELGASEDIFRWWREQGSPSPLLLTEHELATSTDCFAIEFNDIKRSHRLLLGKDVITPLVVDDSFYRAQVEHDLRAKLLRLRQKAGACSPIPTCCAGCCSIPFPPSACCSATPWFCTGWRRPPGSARSSSARGNISESTPRRSRSCSTFGRSASSRAREPVALLARICKGYRWSSTPWTGSRNRRLHVKTALIVVLVLVVVAAFGGGVSQYYSIRNDLVTQRNGMDAAVGGCRGRLAAARRPHSQPGGDREGGSPNMRPRSSRTSPMPARP
jgi:hypothetical protein